MLKDMTKVMIATDATAVVFVFNAKPRQIDEAMMPKQEIDRSFFLLK